MSEYRERIERHSMTWNAITEWAEEQRSSARTKLEVRGLDAVTTECLRERIAIFTQLITLAEIDPVEAGLAAASKGYSIEST
ncbi:hypothetical protein [Thalassobaculum sp.]|uniref:hypothetical protein n=1 Tax=Thalassobaculum sp. TaxID=2022740 RepID=UPI0032EFF7B3